MTGLEDGKEASPPQNYKEVDETHANIVLVRFKKLGPLLILGLFSLSLWRSQDCRHWFSIPKPSEFPLKIPVPISLQRHWGPYTPWYSVEPYTPPPKHCKITQVNILQRHGARYPTSGATKGIRTALRKLLSAVEYTHPSLYFLKKYKYDLGTDQLVEFGAAHAKYTGSEAFERYKHLIHEDNIPFVRASGKQRCIDSATNWTLGFAEASKYTYIPKLNVILSEKRNNTLTTSQCPSAGNSEPQVEAWVTVFGYPISQRLNALAPGSNLTAEDIYSLMLICPFESTAHISKSAFCPPSVFTSREYKQFAYTFDLDKFYNTGYGQPLGRVQGVGYVNELLARLRKQPVEDHTQTNSTLDHNWGTFPLDKNVYIDFTHDNAMVAIYGALGLFKQPEMLDPEHPDKRRTWRANEMVPFASRMVTEKLSCGHEEKEYVRILVNDALQPLEFCGADGKDGLCELQKFVKSQRYAKHNGEGDWEKCFELDE